MKVLLTGGSGVIGEGLIPALLRAGHTVRLLSRTATEKVKEWPAGVKAVPADVADPNSLRGAARGCDAVIHLAGIVEEAGPELTFEKVNVGGTRHLLAEATRSGVSRFIYISSLGADRGTSDYHRSKFKAEELVSDFAGEWLILRPGNVYGPGDEVISTLLKLIRVLPAVPIVDDGQQPFQPIWYEDLGRAILRALETPHLKRVVLELAGAEVTTTTDIIDRLNAITGKEVPVLPVPRWLASLGVQAAEMTNLETLAGTKLLKDSKLKMLLDENVIEQRDGNALPGLLDDPPTRLKEGLTKLVDLMPEQLPSDGVGRLTHKRFWANIKESDLTPAVLLKTLRENCADIMPLEFSAEPGAPREVELGVTLTLALPLRGNVQVRVYEVAPKSLTFVTVEGHMLAGAVQFTTSGDRRRGVRFAIDIYARPATAIDWLAVNTFGDIVQNSNWRQVVERVVELSGGSAPAGVQSESATLSVRESEQVERELKSLVNSFKRAEREDLLASRATGATRPRTAQKARSANDANKNLTNRSGSQRKQKPAEPRAEAKYDAVLSMAAAVSQLAASAVQTAFTAAGAVPEGDSNTRRRKRR